MITKLYKKIKIDIITRIKEFEKIGSKGSEKELFREFIFCILTPQSNARVCWSAAENLYNTNILFNGNSNQITELINNVRFKNNKTKYILQARNKLFNNSLSLKNIIKTENSFDLRDFIVNEFKGIGYKEASHFLRNIGRGKNFAILDRHILKNIVIEKVIDNIPKTLNKSKYLYIEKLMADYSEKINIPLQHLDFVFWYKEKNEIFK